MRSWSWGSSLHSWIFPLSCFGDIVGIIDTPSSIMSLYCVYIGFIVCSSFIILLLLWNFFSFLFTFLPILLAKDPKKLASRCVAHVDLPIVFFDWNGLQNMFALEDQFFFFLFVFLFVLLVHIRWIGCVVSFFLFVLLVHIRGIGYVACFCLFCWFIFSELVVSFCYFFILFFLLLFPSWRQKILSSWFAWVKPCCCFCIVVNEEWVSIWIQSGFPSLWQTLLILCKTWVICVLINCRNTGILFF